MSRNARGGRGAGRDRPTTYTQYQWAGPQRDSPPARNPSHILPTFRTLKHPKSKPQVSDAANPHQREPRPGYREPPKARPHLQPLRIPGRVTSSSNIESIMDTEEVAALVSGGVATGFPPPLPPRVATGPAPEVPAPSNPGLVRTPAAPLEFKPQPLPSFPALLPTETRRGHRGARCEAEAGPGSAGGRHLN